MSHATEVAAIKKLVTLLGGTCNVLHQAGVIHGTAGIPDLYIQMPPRTGALLLGVAEWMEVKVGRDKQSPAQLAFAAREHRCGRSVLVGGLDELTHALGQWGYLPKANANLGGTR